MFLAGSLSASASPLVSSGLIALYVSSVIALSDSGTKGGLPYTGYKAILR